MGRLGHPSFMVEAPEEGVRVKALLTTHNGEVEHTGLVLPPSAGQHLTLKLDIGYNVSFPLEALQSWDGL